MGLLGKLLGIERVATCADCRQAVERAIDLIEPKLRQIGGYPDRYLHAVQHALGYAHDLAAQLPGPVYVSREAFARDPLVHALFATYEDVHSALCVSQAMRTFRHEHPESAVVYAMIGMRRHTKAMLGIELDGDQLRRDVPQQAIYFTDHTLADTGLTEAEARERSALGIFESLVAHVRLRIDERLHEKLSLEQTLDEVRARLHGAAVERREVLEQELNACLQRLTQIMESLDLRRYAEDIDAVLLAPERYVYLQETEMDLDGMGLLREHGAVGSRRVKFCDLIGRDRRHWTVTLVYCDQVHDQLAMGDRFALAERWLGM